MPLFSTMHIIVNYYLVLVDLQAVRSNVGRKRNVPGIIAAIALSNKVLCTLSQALLSSLQSLICCIMQAIQNNEGPGHLGGSAITTHTFQVRYNHFYLNKLEGLHQVP